MKKNYEEKSWSFLVASPSFKGPVFENSVILLLEDSPESSFGIMVNKPIDHTLGEIDSVFKDKLIENIEVFDGGPVAKNHLSFAVWQNDSAEDSSNFLFGITAEKLTEILDSNPDAKAAAFLGYSGWGAEQLQEEIDDGTWLITPVNSKILFDTDPAALWQETLKEAVEAFKELPEPPCSALGKN